MTPHELVQRLEAEGVSVSLNLKVKAERQPLPETVALLEQYRDELLEYLVKTSAPGGLHLPAILLENLMVWTARYHELRIQHPDGLTLNAKPEHIRDAVKLHPWGVVYSRERYQLLRWGAVPGYALQDLRDLETDEPLVPEQVAA